MFGVGMILLGDQFNSVYAVEADDDDYWYMGVGAGYSSLKPNVNGSGFSMADDSDIGYQLQLGYRWRERWALEAFAVDLGEATLAPTGTIEYDAVGLSGIFHIIPSSSHSNFGVYLKTGWAKLNTHADIPLEQAHDNQLLLGAGISYSLNERFELRSELVQYDKDATLFSLNLITRFGQRPRKNLTEFDKRSDRDSDNAKIANLNNLCSDQPGTEVNIAGCATDADSDAVLNEIDQCPDTLPINTISDKRVALFEFDFNAAGLKMAHLASALKIANHMKCDTAATIQLEGHADSIGSELRNQRLSAQRVKQITELLTDYFGIEKSRIRMTAHGEELPKASNNTIAGRRLNRSVIAFISW